MSREEYKKSWGKAGENKEPLNKRKGKWKTSLLTNQLSNELQVKCCSKYFLFFCFFLFFGKVKVKLWKCQEQYTCVICETTIHTHTHMLI